MKLTIRLAGVCDYSKPSVLQHGATPWLTYQDAMGGVVYGGRPMGAAPKSTAVRRAKAKRRRR